MRDIASRTPTQRPSRLASPPTRRCSFAAVVEEADEIAVEPEPVLEMAAGCGGANVAASVAPATESSKFVPSAKVQLAARGSAEIKLRDATLPRVRARGMDKQLGAVPRSREHRDKKGDGKAGGGRKGDKSSGDQTAGDLTDRRLQESSLPDPIAESGHRRRRVPRAVSAHSSVGGMGSPPAGSAGRASAGPSAGKGSKSRPPKQHSRGRGKSPPGAGAHGHQRECRSPSPEGSSPSPEGEPRAERQRVHHHQHHASATTSTKPKVGLTSDRVAFGIGFGPPPEPPSPSHTRRQDIAERGLLSV